MGKFGDNKITIQEIVYGGTDEQRMDRFPKSNPLVEDIDIKSRTCLKNVDMSKMMGNHYENTPMQYTSILHGCKNDNFQLIFFLLFSYFQNIY